MKSFLRKLPFTSGSWVTFSIVTFFTFTQVTFFESTFTFTPVKNRELLWLLLKYWSAVLSTSLASTHHMVPHCGVHLSEWLQMWTTEPTVYSADRKFYPSFWSYTNKAIFNDTPSIWKKHILTWATALHKLQQEALVGRDPHRPRGELTVLHQTPKLDFRAQLLTKKAKGQKGWQGVLFHSRTTNSYRPVCPSW